MTMGWQWATNIDCSTRSLLLFSTLLSEHEAVVVEIHTLILAWSGMEGRRRGLHGHIEIIKLDRKGKSSHRYNTLITVEYPSGSAELYTPFHGQNVWLALAGQRYHGRQRGLAKPLFSNRPLYFPFNLLAPQPHPDRRRSNPNQRVVEQKLQIFSFSVFWSKWRRCWEVLRPFLHSR